VLVMGACRTLLYVMAASAFAITSEVWMWGVLLGIYIMGLSLVARAEGSGTITEAKRWLYFVMLILPAMTVMNPGASWLQIALFFLSVLLISFCLQQMKRGRAHIGAAVGWLLAGIPLVDALALSASHSQVATVFVVLPPLLKVWQRWVAAT